MTYYFRVNYLSIDVSIDGFFYKVYQGCYVTSSGLPYGLADLVRKRYTAWLSQCVCFVFLKGLTLDYISLFIPRIVHLYGSSDGYIIDDFNE